MRDFYDLIIVGSGVAGLSALLASPPAFRVAVVSTGTPLSTGSSWRAQGGVAVALDSSDSPAQHAEDTLRASRFMADREAVRVLTEEGPERVRELLLGGMRCDRDEHGQPRMGLEAAHSRPRVIHQQDRTGQAMIAYLWSLARERQRTVFLQQRVNRLLSGPQGLEGVLLDDATVLASPRVILASGGFAGLYQATTTGREVRGDGIVLAAEVGARVADLEFVQFHPTALAEREGSTPDGALPLLTEALRGAGAVLRNREGERFVDELLGRDEVARAIARERQRGPVYLDLNPIADLAARFPGAASHLQRFPERPFQLPVRPAAHYTIGGVVTDLHGATSVPGLYACGEVASVGVHGANRLASNSLLEGLVFGCRAARHAGATMRPSGGLRLQGSGLTPSLRAEATLLAELRTRFEQACGVVRTAQQLNGFLLWLERQPPVNEVRLARLVAQAALDRSRSLGAHFRADDLVGQPSEGLARVV
jgi:L-aspartate oxidase